MEKKEYQYIVATQCFTFNHAPYIVDAMNGFVMQETSFPVITIIVDDASTDGEPEVIRQYLDEHFQTPYHEEETDDYFLICANHNTNPNCTFAVFLLKYNHYSIKKPKMTYLSKWLDNGKYHALCEGDDYWIDPMKLQKQVEFLESHPDYTMTCNRTGLYSVRKQRIFGENYCYKKSGDIKIKDVIQCGGLFVTTCSTVYRKNVSDNRPDYWSKCKVGDYPLHIACLLKGKAYFFNEIMSVYRTENPKSWMGQQNFGSLSKQRLDIIVSQINMFKGFANDYPSYRHFFEDKIAEHINANIPDRTQPHEDIVSYLTLFSDDIKKFSFRWKVDSWLRRLNIPYFRRYYTRFFFQNYRQKRLLYTK